MAILASNANIMIPDGFRFRPEVEEIINKFLKHKNFGNDSQGVPTIPLSQLDPWEIPDILKMPWEDEMWPFFNIREKYHGNSNRREGKSGFWKSTCRAKKIETKECIGTKRILTFYIKGRCGNKKTDWIIHEYELNSPISIQSECFVFSFLMNNEKKTRIKLKAKKDADISENITCETSHFIASDETVLEHVQQPSFNFTSNSEIGTVNSMVLDMDYEKNQPLLSPNHDQLGWNTSYENTYGVTINGFFDLPNPGTSFRVPHFTDQASSDCAYLRGEDGSGNFTGPSALESFNYLFS